MLARTLASVIVMIAFVTASPIYNGTELDLQKRTGIPQCETSGGSPGTGDGEMAARHLMNVGGYCCNVRFLGRVALLCSPHSQNNALGSGCTTMYTIDSASGRIENFYFK